MCQNNPFRILSDLTTKLRIAKLELFAWPIPESIARRIRSPPPAQRFGRLLTRLLGKAEDHDWLALLAVLCDDIR
jgi:hypothetical protein